MATVDAIYKKGVFRPTSPVSLPEGTRVQLQTVTEAPIASEATQPRQTDTVLDRIYAVLTEVRSSGFSDTAARHDEHAA